MASHARTGPLDGPHESREDDPLASARARREPVEPSGAGGLGAEELGTIRHDLKNVLTTLRHGCTLIGARLQEGSLDDVQTFLDEMRSSIDKGRALVDRLR